ncbi:MULTISPECIES: hypothetical protein [unclassified Cellvibrio]|uniref:hypothetical protein n=1 Tax=unclassified Cellvibrio TaxID=2624793 RepID=UPI0007854943|nr:MULTISPECIES: hypothetical protein [unclassified Cellvibrio]QEY17024.1 hypothetical protein D0C16_14190 [Cellvibrio sp. KY-GH-1]
MQNTIQLRLKPLAAVIVMAMLGACDKTVNVLPSHQQQIQAQLIHTGGSATRAGICPASALDTVVPISALNPSPLVDQPDMTVEGIYAFIQKKDIRSIDELVNYFPAHYQNNFSLVEHTRATGQSNLEYPRIVLFGSDGRFLLNIGTKLDDPKYNLLDVAQLDENTGRWEFSVFDFDGDKPRLIRNDPSCAQCHGTENARPVWGTNLDWPGVFGDNIAPGPQGEALDGKHAKKMNALMHGEYNSPRFSFLQWSPQTLTRGAKRKIAKHAFGAELIMSNIAMGTATARGAFVRLQNIHPQQYKSQRAELLLAYFAKRLAAAQGESAQQLYKQLIQSPRFPTANIEQLLRDLGVDPDEAFSLATLAHLEAPQPDWSMGEGDLLDMVMLQVLNDLRQEDAQLADLLAVVPAEMGVIDCPDTVATIAQLIDFKMLHLFYLRGAARYQVNWIYYPLDAEDIYERVFDPIVKPVVKYFQ